MPQLIVPEKRIWSMGLSLPNCIVCKVNIDHIPHYMLQLSDHPNIKFDAELGKHWIVRNNYFDEAVKIFQNNYGVY